MNEQSNDTGAFWEESPRSRLESYSSSCGDAVVGLLCRPPAEPLYAFNDPMSDVTLSEETKPFFIDMVAETLSPALTVDMDDKDERTEAFKKMVREFVADWVEDIPFYRQADFPFIEFFCTKGFPRNVVTTLQPARICSICWEATWPTFPPNRLRAVSGMTTCTTSSSSDVS